MKIISYVPSDYRLTPLIDKGITEYYFGHIPFFWRRTYSLINSINRRYQLEGQINSQRILEKLLTKNWGKSIKFFLALNNHLYTQRQIEKILSYFKNLFQRRLEGVICADVGLMIALRNQFPHLKIHVSLGAPCLNSEAIKFFKKIGAKRIILDRSITVAEVRSLRNENPDIGLEAFAFQQGCPHAEGVCTHHHGRDCVCLANILSCFPPKIDIKNYYMDCLLRLHLLFTIGVDYIKIPRLAEKGATSIEMLDMYGKIISFIQLLNSFPGQPRLD
jgi:hypothetical protein